MTTNNLWTDDEIGRALAAETREATEGEYIPVGAAFELCERIRNDMQAIIDSLRSNATNAESIIPTPVP